MRYSDCQREDGNCESCSLSSHRKDCRNAPVNEIAYIRHTAGLTQQAISDLLEIPKRTIENWEADKRTPPAYLVKLIQYRINGYIAGTDH